MGNHLVEAGPVSSHNQPNHWEMRIANRDVRNGEEFVVSFSFGLGNFFDEHTTWCSFLNSLARLRGCPSRSKIGPSFSITPRLAKSNAFLNNTSVHNHRKSKRHCASIVQFNMPPKNLRPTQIIFFHKLPFFATA